MSDPHAFLQNLAIVLCVAAVATIVFQRLHQPVVFGYLIAGLIIGPYLPIPLVADPQTVRTLSELGVILLMFSLGLGFSFRKLMQVSQSAGAVAVVESSAMVSLGYIAGQLMGWTQIESVYAGAIIAISSTTIIVKALEERRVGGRVTELIFGVLIIEDLIAIFLLTILTTISASGPLSAVELAQTALRLGAFLVGLIGVGLLLVPRLIRMVYRLEQKETLLITSIGICFAAALLALYFGYSVALGAFIAGSLVGESGHERDVTVLVEPVRDVFAAIFFVSVGMMIDPRLVAEHWEAVLVLTVAVLFGKITFVTISAFLAGHGRRNSIRAGMTLAQIGEFSFIIATVGVAVGATRSFLYPVAIAVSAITTLTTPLLIGLSIRASASIDRWLPAPLQTFATLYGSWIERVKSAPDTPASRPATTRVIRFIILDAVLLVAILIGVAVEMEPLKRLLNSTTGMEPDLAQTIVLLGAAAVATPLLYGMLRSGRTLGAILAGRIFATPQAGKVDPADAPRRAMMIAVQVAVIVTVGIPVLAITQPFLPPLRGLAIFALMMILLVIAVWRDAANLQGHAKAGAQIIASALAQQMASTDGDERNPLHDVNHILPGLGEPVAVRVSYDSIAVGRSLAELNVRGETGATVLAIRRGDEQIPTPLGKEVVRAGDLLAVSGSQDALDVARELFAPHLTARDARMTAEIEIDIEALNRAMLARRR